MLSCHLCRRPWNDHAADCRVLADIDRLRRVHDRLAAEGREDALRDKIGHYLGMFGKLACQRLPDMPQRHQCESCGHMEVCAILPPELGRPKVLD